MADKTFNEQPMITVISDSLDPRVKRQLSAQLQSTMLSVSELNAELDNQKAMEDIKAQKDAVKDQTEFDDDNTEDKSNPTAIENNPDAGTANSEQTGSNDDAGENGSGEGSEDVFSDNSNDGFDDSSNGNSDAGAVQQPQDQQNNQQQSPPATDNGQDQGQQNSQGDANNQQNAGQQSNGQTQTPPPQNQNNQTPAAQPATQSNQQNGQQTQGTDGNGDNGDGGEDPFNDDNVNFEAFAGILGFSYKSESAAQTEDSDLPPIKTVVYVKAGDQGVDNRTSAIVATIEDPENTVVILDQSEVAEVEAKLQFKALTKQLQSRGIMVCESIDQAVEYLNQVYDEVSGKAE